MSVLGTVRCDRCGKRARTKVLESVGWTIDPARPDAVVERRLCPKCGHAVDVSGRGGIHGVADAIAGRIKRRTGLSCPGCGKLGWRKDFLVRPVSGVSVRDPARPNEMIQTFRYDHRECGHGWTDDVYSYDPHLPDSSGV